MSLKRKRSKNQREEQFSGQFQVSREDLFTPVTQISVAAGALSVDTRRVHTTAITFDLPSPQKKRQRELARELREKQRLPIVGSEDFGFIWEGFYTLDDGTGSRIGEDEGDEIVTKVVVVKRRYLSSDAPMFLWKPLRNEYLAEMIRVEGRGDYYSEVCPVCYRTDDDHKPLYQCTDCFSPELLCGDCCRDTHMDNPLHIVRKWDGKCFHQVYLKDIGVTLQLGHPRGVDCDRPRRGNVGFLVVHTNGIHPVAVYYCDCPGRSVSFRQQCMRHRWFPASQDDPQTCATFKVLDLFHKMTLHGKVNVYDFMSGLEKMTNKGGIEYQKDRYREFARMAIQYRHLLILKRSGRGNDLDKRPVEETKPGECAMDCIACPKPGVNLPEDWENVSMDLKFLYNQFVAIDACFRLKRRLVSSEAKDPGLGTGWSYFVEDPTFRDFLKTVTTQTEMSTCSGLAALDYANTRYSRGYGSTGAAIGVCARHELVQRTGAVDLQKGERYANMDYVYGSILRHIDPRLPLVNSYDICCQWHKNLSTRMETMPELVQVDTDQRSMEFVIPKLHIHGHNLKCQLNFSLNYTPGVGRTDGEGIERPWANIGPVATSTREMGPGTRHDTLDDHLHHWNWMKTVNLGKILYKRLHNAVSERNAQRHSFDEFKIQQAEKADEWIKLVTDWEQKVSDINPFALKHLGMTENEVRLALAEQEKEDEHAGVPSIHQISPSAFIAHGLELEEQQRRLEQDVKKNRNPTTKELTTILERRTRLSRAIGRFRAIQATYTPAALQVLSQRGATPTDENPENIPLMLPSALTAQQRELGCRSGLLETELKLRDAQMRQALEHLRNHLHIRARLVTYRDSNVRHQSMLTRSRAMIARNDTKTEAHKRRYQAAWEAVLSAHGGDISAVKWTRLKDPDVRCLSSEADRAWQSARKVLGKKKRKELEAAAQNITEDLTASADNAQLTREEIRDRAGNGYTKTSWIWMQGGTGEMIDEERMRDGIRVEFCKAYARTKRWTEEVLLLREEMRRALVTLEWKAKWWEQRTTAPSVDDIHAEGISAYAHSQAAVMRALRDRFQRLWEGYESLEEVDDDDKEDTPARVMEIMQGGDPDGRDALDEEAQEDEDEDDGFMLERDLH
ncbi:hypothetical protein VKT23_020034 [Stygiomarasmius scandens]|uniref:CxC2-like cysteine cluster KDZ transposase-associated domain-containing protein n=1 Tax=Marasmiellus scandens TaxID=2682957 RepID=A0ABR1IP47_9AGAR